MFLEKRHPPSLRRELFHLEPALYSIIPTTNVCFNRTLIDFNCLISHSSFEDLKDTVATVFNYLDNKQTGFSDIG